MGLRKGEEPKEEEKKEPEQPVLKKRVSKAADKKAELLKKAEKKEEKLPVAAPELKKVAGKKAQPKAVAAADVAKEAANFIYVQVVRVKSKMRLRIVNSTNYNKNWNCQGPRSIRIEGRVYRIDNPKVKVIYGGDKGKASFYKLSNDVSIYQTVMEGCNKTVTTEDLKKLGLKVF